MANHEYCELCQDCGSCDVCTKCGECYNCDGYNKDCSFDEETTTNQ